MSKTIDIELQRFEFGDSWTVFKFDDETDLLKLKKGVDGTKDADIVGIFNDTRLYLMEITDLRGHRIENRDKLKHGEMVQEFVQKIRDTIPAIVGAFHTTDHKEQWNILMQKLADRSEKIRTLLWIEQDRPRNSYEENKRSAELDTLTKFLKKHLSWLTPRVLVENKQTYRENLDFKVSDLSGAGQP